MRFAQPGSNTLFIRSSSLIGQLALGIIASLIMSACGAGVVSPPGGGVGPVSVPPSAQSPSSPPSPPPGTGVSGSVASTRGGPAVPGARITAGGTSITATTSAQGAYSLALNPGTYDIVAAKPGMAASKFQGVTVSAGRMATADLIMLSVADPSKPASPPTLSVSGLSQGQMVTGTISVTVSVTAANPVGRIDVRSSDTNAPQSSIRDSSAAAFSLNSSALANGPAFVDIIAYDSNQNVAELVVNFTVNNSAPGSAPAGGGAITPLLPTTSTAPPVTLPGGPLAAPLPTSLASQAAVLPQSPRIFLNTIYTPPSGQTIPVLAGGDFQAALNTAQPGDVITLAAGATFQGPFTLPNKSGPGWIIVRTSAPDSSLPPPGSRVAPSHAPVMPKIVVGSGSGGAVKTVPGAHYFRFIGIEFAPVAGQFVTNLIELGAGETTAAALPNNIIFDRCYIHGDPTVGGRRGVLMNSASTAVIDSYLADFKEQGSDSQALLGWNGPGPFKIVNNFLEGAGENVMFGGATTTIPNVVPSDIEIRGNHFFKPLSWRPGDPSYAGTPWTVKNLFELKNAARVLVDGNILEFNWVGADQAGFAIQFTPRGESGTVPWAVVADVTFTHNIVQHSPGGVNMLGFDDSSPSRQLQRVFFQNNLFTDIGGAMWGFGRLFQFVGGTAHVIIDHNTAVQTEAPIYAASGPHEPNTGFIFTNTITPNNQFGLGGDGTTGSSLLTLKTYFPGYVFDRNVIPGGNASDYPPDNFFPVSLVAVGFVNLAGGDYHLLPTSPFKGQATDGTDPGANIDALNAATARVNSGIGGSLTPPPSYVIFSPPRPGGPGIRK